MNNQNFVLSLAALILFPTYVSAEISQKALQCLAEEAQICSGLECDPVESTPVPFIFLIRYDGETITGIETPCGGEIEISNRIIEVNCPEGSLVKKSYTIDRYSGKFEFKMSMDSSPTRWVERGLCIEAIDEKKF